MRASIVFINLFLFLIPSRIIAHPLSPSPSDLASRRTKAIYCDNFPKTRAGTLLIARDHLPASPAKDVLNHRSTPTTPPPLLPFSPRDDEASIWCANGTETYIAVSLIAILGNHVHDLLQFSYSAIHAHITHLGDGVIHADSPFVYSFSYKGLTFEVGNAGGNEITYGVLGAALIALEDFMKDNIFGSCRFRVYDGVGGLVGAGSVV